MKRLTAVLLALLVSPSAIVGGAQEVSPLLHQIEGVITANQPNWRMVKKNLSKDRQYVSYKWKRRTSSIEVLLVFNSSKDLAIERFKTLPSDLELGGLAMKPSETQLRLGDEASSWNSISDHRVSGILLRKGRVVANVSGTSKDAVTRFASQIAEVLPSE
jgi:hypothetical protein